MKKTLTTILIMIMVITMAQPIEASAATSARPVVKTTQKVVSKGKKLTLKAVYNGRNVTKKATWKSSNKKVATIKNGKLNAKKAGTTYVTAIYKKTSKKVKITVAETKLNKTKVSLKVGEAYTLKATYNKKAVKPTFKTSNAAVATVSKAGVVNAKNTGIANIMVIYKGIRVSCKVTVAKAPHTHDYKPVYRTVHHDEVGHYENQNVCVKEAYDEEITDGAFICNGCKKQFIYGEYGSPDAALDALLIHQFEESIGCGGYHSEEVTYTKYHEAEYEIQNVWVVDKPAYDEEIITGYKCSCGATK